MEMAIQKRQNIRFKNEALKSRDSTESEIERACQDLRRNIQATKKESDATETRIRDLQERRAQLTADLQNSNENHDAETQRLEQLQQQLHDVNLCLSPLLSVTSVTPGALKQSYRVHEDARLSKNRQTTGRCSERRS